MTQAVIFFLFQGHSGGTLCLRLCFGHPLHGHQGLVAIPDHHSRCQVEEQGVMGDLQRLGFVGFPFVSCSQPASAVLLSVDPDTHGSVYLEETPLWRSPNHHHALLVWSGLLLLSGKQQTWCRWLHVLTATLSVKKSVKKSVVWSLAHELVSLTNSNSLDKADLWRNWEEESKMEKSIVWRVVAPHQESKVVIVTHNGHTQRRSEKSVMVERGKRDIV